MRLIDAGFSQSRTKWGFDGFVVSDYDSIVNMLNDHHYVSSLEDAISVAINAGCDQVMRAFCVLTLSGGGG